MRSREMKRQMHQTIHMMTQIAVLILLIPTEDPLITRKQKTLEGSKERRDEPFKRVMIWIQWTHPLIPIFHGASGQMALARMMTPKLVSTRLLPVLCFRRDLIRAQELFSE